METVKKIALLTTALVALSACALFVQPEPCPHPPAGYHHDTGDATWDAAVCRWVRDQQEREESAPEPAPEPEPVEEVEDEHHYYDYY